MGVLDNASKGISDARNTIKNPFKRSVQNSLQGNDFPDGFQIEEVEGPAKEKISLVGHLMPLIPFTFGGEQRMIKEFYSGNSEPVVHILGPEETEITIVGRLWDKKFNQSDIPGENNYGISAKLQLQLDEFRIRGNLLKIKLGEFQRFAFMSRTEFPMAKLGDIRYRITFLIVGFNPPLRTQFTGEPIEIPFASNRKLNALLDDFNANFSIVPTEVPASVTDIMNDAISIVATPISEVISTVDALIGTVEDVQKGLFRAVGVIKNAQNAVQAFKNRIGSIDFGAPFRSSQPSARYSAYNYIGGTNSAMTDFATLLEFFRKQFINLIDSIPLRRVTVIPGDTLQKIAANFYDNDQEWRRIFDHNQLTDTNLVAGSVLEIPRLS